MSCHAMHGTPAIQISERSRVIVLRHALAVCILSVVGPAWGQISFDLPGSDEVVSMTGLIEGRPLDMTRTVRVRLQGAAADTPLIIRSTAGALDAVREPASGSAPPVSTVAAIPAANVTIEEKSVQGEQAVDLSITVKGVSAVGIYRGPVELFVVSQPAVRRRIQLELAVGAKPVMEVADKAISMSASNCTGRCWFTEWIAPGTTSSATFVTVLNKSPVPLNVEATSLLKGTLSPLPVLLHASARTVIAPGQTAPVVLVTPRTTLVPDRYSGTVTLAASPVGLAPSASVQPDGQIAFSNQSLVAVPVTVDIRAAALLPFIIVLLGVAAGRLAKFLSDGGRQARVTLYGRYRQDMDDVEKLRAPGARAYYRDTLESLWTRAVKGDPTDATLLQEFTTLESAVRLFLAIERLQDTANALQAANPNKQLILDKLTEASKALIKGETTAAGTAIEAARQLLYQSQQAAVPLAGGPDARAEELAPALGVAAENARELKQRTERQQSTPRIWTERIVRFFSGVDSRERIEAWYWFVRPLTFLALVLLVAFYGLWLQYGGPEHSTFGSKGVADYLGLFLWGFGAQVVAMSFKDVSFVRTS